jgi:Fe-Mn family superoxide dismutase
MSIILMKLPYAADALAPAISAETLKVHHGKHHKTYVDKVNEAVKGTAADDKALEQIIAEARGSDPKLFNSAAQAWNHGLYWVSMTPHGKAPEGELAAAITRDFGSPEALGQEMAKQGAEHFGSGWLWLVSEGGKLAVKQTHDAETFADQRVVPLLVIDLWEHAYYLDRKNERPEYLGAAIKLLDWTFAAAQYSGDRRWAYPADGTASSLAA